MKTGGAYVYSGNILDAGREPQAFGGLTDIVAEHYTEPIIRVAAQQSRFPCLSIHLKRDADLVSLVPPQPHRIGAQGVGRDKQPERLGQGDLLP
jgi:hypothetical protein